MMGASTRPCVRSRSTGASPWCTARMNASSITIRGSCTRRVVSNSGILARRAPPLAEEAAVRRMLFLAKRTGAPLYIVHVSGQDSVHAITDARAGGVAVFAEVLHPNLV